MRAAFYFENQTVFLEGGLFCFCFHWCSVSLVSFFYVRQLRLSQAATKTVKTHIHAYIRMYVRFSVLGLLFLLHFMVSSLVSGFGLVHHPWSPASWFLPFWKISPMKRWCWLSRWRVTTSEALPAHLLSLKPSPPQCSVGGHLALHWSVWWSWTVWWSFLTSFSRFALLWAANSSPPFDFCH